MTDDATKKDCPYAIKDVPIPKIDPDTACTTTCTCPGGGGGSEDPCFNDLIGAESVVAKTGESAKEFVEILKAIQGKVNGALGSYTTTRVTALTALWVEQDRKIAELAINTECVARCWKCVVECKLCLQLNRIWRDRRRLYGKGNFPAKVDSVTELLACVERMQGVLQRDFDSVKDLLAVWEDPSKVLGDLLDKDQALIGAIPAKLNSDAPSALYDLFATLIPRHLAIAPPGLATKIDARFINPCATCDPVTESDCCEVKFKRSVLLDLLGPMPYIIDRAAFPKLICCLVEHRYLPVKNALADMKGEWAKAKAEFDALTAALDIKAVRDAVPKAFKQDLSTPLDCKPFTPPGSGGGTGNGGGCGANPATIA